MSTPPRQPSNPKPDDMYARLPRALTTSSAAPAPRIRSDFPEPIGGSRLYSTGAGAAFSRVREAIADNDWERHDSTPFPIARVTETGARGYVQLRPSGIEAISPTDERLAVFAAAMWEQAELSNPLNADAYDILASLTIEHKGEGFVIDMDDALDMRGLQPKKGGQRRRGGYEPEQRNAMYQAFVAVANAEVSLTLTYQTGTKKKPKKGEEVFQSRLWAITDTRQQRLDGSADRLSIYVVPGSLHKLQLMGPGRQVALLDAKVLGFDFVRQAPEKFLGRYLSRLWRIRAQTQSYRDPLRVATLLEHSHIDFDEQRPKRTYDRLIKALDALLDAGIIKGYRADWDWATARSKNWGKTWLQSRVSITPPDAIVEHYDSNIRRTEPTPKALPTPRPKPNLSGRLKAARGERSQGAIADALGIPQQTYSRAERGLGIKPETVAKLEAWLDAQGKQDAGVLPR